ncbi:cbb3-type cytochrome oxidase assembly protein CcoS [Dyella sp. C9]|uniref:cbb3-type cytochrome oxidase assembly protein CcoS n=1 Tax=Dyella sp. C9 TaxID=2202154 RepID=UPI000DEF75FC|nr:cbb3-type cytochrome oxidase assembly protein CcoS [Dyella sp. C9]
MIILLMLIPLSLMLLGVAIGAFVWAVRRGQFDDMDTPPLDILRDEPLPTRPVSPGAETGRHD